VKIISVIPLKKGALRGDLTYFTSLEIPAGNIVTVPVRKQNVPALVTSSEDLKSSKSDVKGMDFNLRKVQANLGKSIFLKEFLESIFDVSDYFAQNKNSAITSLIPSIFIEKYEKLAKIKKGLQADEKNSRSIKSEKLLFQYPFRDRISVYKTLVRESFARGKSIFLVLPTESDIAKFEKELKKGIEQFTFALHSGIPAGKNLISYEKIVTSSHPVLILGTPPYLSVPLQNIGTIILEHENSNGYRMIGRPYFDLRIFAELYASKLGARFIMADELLRFETIGRADTDHLAPLHPLSYRIDFAGDTKISKREAGERGDRKKFQILNEDTVNKIRVRLEENKKVFIFSLRKGLATQTLCRDCGDTVSCKKCGAPLVLYLTHSGQKRMFVCNRCEEEKEGDTACSSCKSWNLVPLGIGTDTVYEEIKKLFPKTPVFQLDKESAKTAAGAKKIIKEFTENKSAILIGTEMSFFYQKEEVALSVVASFDSLWSIPNFKMSEKIIHIILSTVNITEEELIIQTKNDKDIIIESVKSGNLLSFVREELADRKKLDYPPFKRFIKITHTGSKEETRVVRKVMEEMFEGYAPEIFSGFVARIKGKYITNALIKLDPKRWSLPEISAGGSIDKNLLEKLSSLPAVFAIHVDPEDLL
jgi:primosomal protein N' (replication factor Y)